MKSLIALAMRFILFTIIIAALIATSVIVFLESRSFYIYSDSAWDDMVPYQVLPADSDYNIVLDSHTHTLYSDGILTIRQAALWHIAMGYNAMFITDHNTLDNKAEILLLKDEFKDEIIIMQGMEWTTGRIHLNLLGISEWDHDEFPINRQPTDEEIERAIAEAHRQGGVVIACHYVWTTAKNKPTRQQLLEWGVDYFEIVNDDCDLNNYYDTEGIAFANEHNIGLITGTDMHYPNRLQVDGKVHGWTLLETPEFTQEAIMEQLRLKNTEILYSEEGVPSLGHFPLKDSYKWAVPLIHMGSLMRQVYIGATLDWGLMFVIISYAIVIFAMAELMRLVYRLLFRKE